MKSNKAKNNFPMQYVSKYDTPIGTVTLASNGEELTGLWFENQKYFGATLDMENIAREDSRAIFCDARKWLDSYFKKQKPSLTLPLAPIGSAFRQKVWEVLRKVPYGEMTTYGTLAKEMTKSSGENAAQINPHPVGGAVAHNPISIFIPCHRVLGSDKSLTGYAGGIEKKIFLLELEGAYPRAGTMKKMQDSEIQ